LKFNKILLVSIILLAILTLGAASAADNAAVDDLAVAGDSGDLKISSSLDDGLATDCGIATDDVAVGENVTKLKSYNQEVLSNDDAVVTQDSFYNYFDDEGKLLTDVTADELILRGEFSDLTEYLVFDRPVSVTGDGAVLNDMGITISGADVTLKNLTLIANDVEFDLNDGALIYVSGENAVLDGLTIDYAPGDSYDAYAIYMDGAKNFQLLNCDVNFTGSSLEENYEYAMKIIDSQEGLVEGNVIRANLPILDVDYNKGDPGLDTDLVLNTGIKDSSEIDIVGNTFIANVIGCNGDYPTLDCVMIESCEGLNIIGNTFNETDFLIEEGKSNYLNVLDMYYSNSMLVQGNKISVETNGGAENAGTSYPIQLTGPYEDVVIDGNDLYSRCGGPALGIFSQNYYGDTEITVKNNNIDITGLPTLDNWGLVSGIELQDNVARVYNNTIKTKSVTGTYNEGDNLYGISYAQALNENHCYDIQNNTIETEGKYTIYLLKAQDTTITGNSLASSLLVGDDSVYIQDASGNTIIEDNTGIDTSDNIVTPENFFSFFDDEGFLLDSVNFDELIFKGDFSNLVDMINLERPITITGDGAVLNDMAINILSSGVALNDLAFIANSALGSLIYAEAVDDINLTNLNIFYEAPEGEEAVAIDFYQVNDVNILGNVISFESHVTSDELKGIALQLVDTKNVVVNNNEITTKLPCVYVLNYDEDYYLMGSNNVNPVRLKDCHNLIFTYNYINSTTNNYSAEFPTIQSIYIIGCHNCLLDHNTIYMIDEMTPAGMDNYLYGIDFGNDYNVTFSYNTFVMSTKGGKDAAGTAYAFQGVESDVIIKGNNITSISNGPNLGVYVASMFGETSELLIEDNFINVTGWASKSGNWALVSGIEIQNGNAKIYNNTIYTYNVNDYDDDNYMYGISYAQWMYGDRSFDIENNTVYTEGKYTISIIDADYLIANGNTLYAHELNGSDSIDPGDCEDVQIGENFPPSLTNIVTQDNFYDFFDEFGNLLDSVEFDELIFQGDFVDLVSYITIDRALTITGDSAVLNDIAFIIAGSDVTLNNMTLVANSNLGNLIDIAAENVVISNMNITYVVDEAASAINVYSGANNVQILNNTINFESTVDEYAVDEVTTAICANSGVSIFDDEDPIEGLVIDGNTITAVIPAFLADVYENEYYVMGLSAVNGVRINGAEDFKFTNNNLDVTTNWLYRTTPTFQALYVASSSGLIDGNNISMIDTFTPAGKDVYLYAVELINDEELTISNNNFNLSTTGGKDEAGSAYAIIAISSDFGVVDNNITTVSNGPNLAIYFPSNMGSPCDAVITGNFINVTGLATAAHDTGLVSGIEVQTGSVLIEDNEIYTYNIGDYDENNYIFGISYAQSGVNSEFEIKNNTIYTEGHYAVSLKSANDAIITNNYLVSTDLCGDDSVYIGSGSGNVVEDNLPAKSLANITVAADPVWTGSNATVSVTVPNATGTVTIEVNGKSYTVDLVDGVATFEVVAEDLVDGENIITATYEGPEFATSEATGVLFVADGVVTQDTYLYYFNQEDDGRLFDYVPEGATLDFQGSIINPDTNIIVQMNVNKPVNIVSTTKDAYVDLNTTAGSLLGESPGNSFAVTNGGSGSNVTGIYFHNTQVWIANTHNVVLDNISVVVEDQRVGSGVGATSIRQNSTNVVLKNSYLYTRNNGGSTTFTMSWATNCTIDNCTVKAEGNVGNLVYLNTFNVPGAPTGVPLNTYNKVINNKIYGKEGSGISVGLMVEGANNLIANNTLYRSSISTSFGGQNPANNTYVGNTMTDGSGLTALANSIVYGNNVSGALSTGANSVAYDNTVGGKMTVAAGATAYDNTVGNGLTTGGANAVIENNTITGAVTINKVGTTFVGNNVTGTVTVSANNNVIKENNITTTGNYAVDLGSKTGNNVTDNLLIASELKGDAAVKFTNADNVVENNYPVTSDLVISVEDVVYGEDAVVNVEFNPKATGTIVVSIDGTDYTVNITSEGQGSAIIPGLAANDYDVTATFTPDSAYSLDSDANASFTVFKANATMEAAADSVKVGDDVIVNVTFDKDDVTGTVSITVDGTDYTGAIEDGAATIVIPGLSAGEYAVDVIYAGDGNYNDTTASVSFAVDKYAVEFTKAKGHPGRVDQNATVEVILSESDATGTVSIIVNGTEYSAELVDGKAIIYAPLLPAGTYNFDVIYSGDGKYENNTAPITFNVNKYYPTMKATADDVQVDENAIANVVLPSDATGTVTITVDGIDYTADVVDGAATVELPVISEAGKQAFTVSYSGDDKYRPQTTTVKYNVNKINATIKATARTVKLGNNVTVNVVLPSDATGEVSITINGTSYTGAAEVGAATIIIPDLGVGQYALPVDYAGDGKYNAANTTVTFNVNKQTTSIKATAKTVKVGDDVTVNVALASDATGTVAIDINGTEYTAEVENGAATIIVPGLGYGQYSLDVVYSGDDKYKARTTTVTFNVNKQSTTMKATARTVKVGDDVTVNVALASDVTGDVIITVDGVDYTATVVDGVATIVIPDLPAGQYALAVKYSGDDKYKNQSTTVKFNVNKYNVKMKATAKYYQDGDYSIVSVTLSDDATGSVSVEVNGNNYTTNVVDGSALIAISKLPAGDYPLNVVYSGDAKYKEYTVATTLKVVK